MKVIDAFHLPGIESEDVTGWELKDYGNGVQLRFPRLDSAMLGRLLDRLHRAREAHLATMPVHRLTEILGRATQHMADNGSLALARQALPAVTGYSPAMIRLGLTHMIADWQEPALRKVLEMELGDPLVLDGFRRRTGSTGILTRAFGPRLAFHVLAGNVPGIGVTALLRSLLVKAATLGKTASGEPLLAALYAQALASVSPELGECVAVSYWPGGNTDLEELAMSRSDAVVVYGSGPTMNALRARVPANTRLILHGPRFSVGLIGRECLQHGPAREVAAAAAQAVAIFDQQGCVSPHLFYVEQGGGVQPEMFAALLAEELERLQDDLPRGQLSGAAAATIHQTRGMADFRSSDSHPTRVLGEDHDAFTVVYDTRPSFEPSPLNRFIWVKPLEDLAKAITHLTEVATHLQSVGIAGAGSRLVALAEALGAAGATRITTIQGMPWPPPAWHHDGYEPLRQLLRWTDLEPETEGGQEKDMG